MAGHQYDLGVGLFFGEAAKHVISFVIILRTELDVAKHERPLVAPQFLKRAFRRRRLADYPAFAGKRFGNIAANQLVVIYYQGIHSLKVDLIYSQFGGVVNVLNPDSPVIPGPWRLEPAFPRASQTQNPDRGTEFRGQWRLIRQYPEFLRRVRRELLRVRWFPG